MKEQSVEKEKLIELLKNLVFPTEYNIEEALAENGYTKEILKILVSVFTCFVLTFASLNFSIIHEIKKFNCYICSYS